MRPNLVIITIVTIIFCHAFQVPYDFWQHLAQVGGDLNLHSHSFASLQILQFRENVRRGLIQFSIHYYYWARGYKEVFQVTSYVSYMVLLVMFDSNNPRLRINHPCRYNDPFLSVSAAAQGS